MEKLLGKKMLFLFSSKHFQGKRLSRVFHLFKKNVLLIALFEMIVHFIHGNVIFNISRLSGSIAAGCSFPNVCQTGFKAAAFVILLTLTDFIRSK